MRRAMVGLICTLLAAGASGSDWSDYPLVAGQQTAFTLGSGGYLASIGTSPFKERLPNLGSNAVSQTLNIGGVELEREVVSEADGSFFPILIGLGMSETTDLYFTGAFSTGTRQKTIKDFYGNAGTGEVVNRIYTQPLFDVGVGIKRMVKPDYGDGLPALAFGVRARGGYTTDDFESPQDDTPEDGYLDAGGNAYLAMSAAFGEFFRAHGSVGIDVSQKMGARSQLGLSAELAAVPGTFDIVASYAMRRNIAGLETNALITLGLRYHFSSSSSAQAFASQSQDMYLEASSLGGQRAGLKPSAPMQELF